MLFDLAISSSTTLIRPIKADRLNRKILCLSQNKQSKTGTGKSWIVPVSLSLFGSGFFLGPLLDGLHSRVNLVVYQNGAFQIGPLHTNIWVPFLLGLFYSTVGLLQLLLDERTSTYPPRGNLDRTWLGFTIATIIGIACPLAEIPIMQASTLCFHSKDFDI